MCVNLPGDGTMAKEKGRAGGPKVVVGMPAYNEESYIGSMVLQAKQYADVVVVVDDGSTDRTVSVAEMAEATVVKHEVNRGVGVATQSILAKAKELDADVLVLLDADSQHDPGEIPALVNAVSKGNDLAIGSRTIKRDDIPGYRRLGQRVLSNMSRVLSRKDIWDTESGFRALSQKALSQLQLKETGFAVEAEMISAATSLGLKITEVPVSIIYTRDGSTMNPLKHGAGVLQRIMVMISERRPLLFFGLGGGLLIAGGVAAGVMVAVTYYSSFVLATGTALISMLLVTLGVLCIFTGIILSVLVRRLDDRR
jgi:glycosyltransferase involved in cell wall biosynthesis